MAMGLTELFEAEHALHPKRASRAMFVSGDPQSLEEAQRLQIVTPFGIKMSGDV
jgi:hypothetical protein